jgi:hypothetical protein
MNALFAVIRLIRRSTNAINVQTAITKPALVAMKLSCWGVPMMHDV